MCRTCGRMVRCIFDSMPSRTQARTSRRSFMNRSSAHASPRPPHASSGDILRSALDIRQCSSSYSPPTFLLPLRRKLHQTTSDYSATSPSQFEHTQPHIPPTMLERTIPGPQSQLMPSDEQPSNPSTTPTTDQRTSDKPLVLSKSLQALLPFLTSQPPHYATLHIHRFPYLLTTGDTLRLPFHMPSVLPGDILRLNRASLLGSREYTLKAGSSSTETYDTKRTNEPNYLDERLFECRARVLGIESGPLLVKEKTKRRNRRVKTVKSKHRYTVLKIVELKVKTLEELKDMQVGGALLLES